VQAFLDEIFKANSAILNTLLTILNERKFDNGAGRRVSCPLKCVIGASNELPDSDELDALLDRFLLRSYVTPVSDDGLVELLSTKIPSGTPASDANIINLLEDVISKISTALDEVSIGQNICILIRDLRTFLRDELDIYVSDRRLVKACRLLKVSAATHGRRRVDFIDCLLLQHVLWKYPEQRDTIRDWLLDNMTPGNDDIVTQTKFLLQGLRAESLEVVKKTMGDTTGEAGARTSDLDVISSITIELDSIAKLLKEHYDELERHIQLLHSLSNHLWINRNDAQASKQYLSPVAEEATVSVRQALLDTTSLKLALTSTSIVNEVRSSAIEALTDQYYIEASFTDDELQMSLKDAKRRYTGDQLRRWKSARQIFESTS
jgi:MoxR-like ATPase